VAAIVAVAMSEILLMALTGFGSIPGIIVALVLPLMIGAVVFPDKKRFLLRLIILTVPILIVSPPPRRLGLTLGDVFIFALATYVVLEKLVSEDRNWHWRGTILTWPLLAVLLVALLSALVSRDIPLAISDILENVRYVLFYVICVNAISDKEELKRACRLLLIGFVPSALLSLAQFYLGFGLDIFGDAALPNTAFEASGVDVIRVFGPFQESLTFAQYLVVPLALVAGLASYPRRPAAAVLLLGLFAMGSLALVLTLSRGTWVAFSIALLLVVWLRLPKRLVPYLIAWAVIIAIATISYWYVVQSLIPASVMARIGDLGRDYLIGRGYTWSAAARIVADHPFLGIGLRNLYHVLPEYAPAVLGDEPVWAGTVGSPLSGLTGYTFHMHVDSFYVTVLTEIGMLGTIPVVIVFFRAIARAFANYRQAPADLKPYALGILGALVAMTASMMTTYAYADIRLAVLLWLLFAMTVALQRLVDPDAA
jgi:O-antigen ligase